ncbi:taste receptor type 2 member 41-like [Eleutherodactylus coqui]|uniref:taste receptor type 2 member 41-like n=1 Tax=Eleutherodactylus coqui TaxID=57060 RepID=UPI0034631757
MKLELIITRSVILVITGVTGTFINSIIVLLNFRFWRDVTTSKSYNRLLFVIGLTNTILQAHFIFDAILKIYSLYLLNENLLLCVITFGFTLVDVNIWNTTWLSLLCCVRLVNSSHCFYLKIKAKFFSSLPLLIVGSVLFAVTINLPLFWTTKLHIPTNTTDSPASGYFISLDAYYIIFSSLFGFSVPFCMTCVSIGFSISTLLGHIRRMERSDSHLTSAQLQGHYRAVKTMVIRVFLDFLFFFIIVLGVSVPLILNSTTYSVLWLAVLTYPTSQAFILVFGNPKLKSAVCGLIKC